MTAQWADDVHHALHWLLTGEAHGYYADFASSAAAAHALEHGFHHDGRWSSFRGRTHGRPIDWALTDPWRLIVALQTHDQVGNRAQGERLSALVDPDLLAGGAALLLSLPYTPMLFMGEEWGATTPWRYFTSFPGEALGEAVTEGRRLEFETHGWRGTDVPDPQAPETFWASKLDWALDPSRGSRLTAWYHALSELRRREPDLGPGWAAEGATTAARIRCSWGGEGGRPDWFAVARGPWRTVVNLSSTDQTVPVDGTQVVLSWGEDVRLADGLLALPPGSCAVVRG